MAQLFYGSPSWLHNKNDTLKNTLKKIINQQKKTPIHRHKVQKTTTQVKEEIHRRTSLLGECVFYFLEEEEEEEKKKKKKRVRHRTIR